MTRKDEQEGEGEPSSAYATALLRSLHFSGVQFLRYFTVDVCNNVRCKVKPVGHLLQNQKGLEGEVSIASVCYAGLPYYADYMIANETGLDATTVQTVQPDLNSFRILPYAPKSALVMGNLFEQHNSNSSSNEPSPLCARGLLRKVVQEAAEKHNIAFSVGIEIEFCLVNAATGTFVDNSVFANTDTLNDQEEFLTELCDQLRRQYIEVELLHAESGPGQVEVVLKYSHNPVALADSAVLTQETIRAAARKYGMKALFLPKYDPQKAGNGRHLHFSIRNAMTGKPIFSQGSSLTSDGSAFLEGILQHLPALMGLTLPTTNSFRRVGAGCWTGSVVGWAVEDKESALRVCSNLATGEWDHVEYKLCDSTCNIYLSLAALLASGLDGIKEKLELRPSLSLSSDTGTPPALPGTLVEALDALEEDELLMKLMGPRLSKGYLGLRRHEADRAAKMTLEEEVQESLARP